MTIEEPGHGRQVRVLLLHERHVTAVLEDDELLAPGHPHEVRRGHPREGHVGDDAPGDGVARRVEGGAPSALRAMPSGPKTRVAIARS